MSPSTRAARSSSSLAADAAVTRAWSRVRPCWGYSLKARETKILRRIGKDTLTVIPFVIILIIPLSPLGHVLVFSFIQRFFPDFFPSQFTESRQGARLTGSSSTAHSPTAPPPPIPPPPSLPSTTEHHVYVFVDYDGGERRAAAAVAGRPDP